MDIITADFPGSVCLAHRGDPLQLRLLYRKTFSRGLFFLRGSEVAEGAVEHQVIGDFEARAEEEGGGERKGAHQGAGDRGGDGPSDTSRDVRDPGGLCPLLLFDDGNDVGLTCRDIHLDEGFPQKEQGNRKAEIRGEWDGDEEKTLRDVGKDHRVHKPDPFGKPGRAQMRKAV